MGRKRNLLVLQRLAQDSDELESMAAELSGGEVETLPCGAKPAHWTDRFAASGKAIGKKVLAHDEESI
jgi:hypothetical protein